MNKPETTTKLALVTVIRDEEALLQWHIDFHKALGVSRYYLYLDDCDDRSREIALRNPSVRILNDSGFSLPSSPYFSERQIQVMQEGMRLALQEGYDWLMHIDVDEFALIRDQLEKHGDPFEWMRRASLPSMLEALPGTVEQVVLKSAEVVPVCDRKGKSPLLDGFRYFIKPDSALLRRMRHPRTGKKHRIRGLLGHRAGKSIVRVSPDYKPCNPHFWIHVSGDPSGNPEDCALNTVYREYLYHYVILSRSQWRDKYVKLSAYAGTWRSGRPLEYFKRASMELAREADDREVAAWLQQIVVAGCSRLWWWRLRGWIFRDPVVGSCLRQVRRAMRFDALPVPRIIWFLWLQGKDELPETQRSCLASWEKFNPDWELRFLTHANIREYLPDLDTIVGRNRDFIRAAALSDIIRINLLNRYGGVWTDATCLCRKPLDAWLHEYMGADFFAFRNPNEDRMVASWFLASRPGALIAHQWCEATNAYWQKHAFRKGADGRLKKILRRNRWLPLLWFNPLITRGLRSLPYYWFHYLFARQYYTDPKFRKTWEEARPREALPSIYLNRLQPGMLNPVNEEIKAWIGSTDAPCFKLSSRQRIKQHVLPTVLDYVLQLALKG